MQMSDRAYPLSGDVITFLGLSAHTAGLSPVGRFQERPDT
jgi:hypothetical protein